MIQSEGSTEHNYRESAKLPSAANQETKDGLGDPGQGRSSHAKPATSRTLTYEELLDRVAQEKDPQTREGLFRELADRLGSGGSG